MSFDIDKWYKDKSDSSTVWPYDILDDGLKLNGDIGVKRSGSTESRIEIDPGISRIDLNNELDPNITRTWDKIGFSLHVQIANNDEKIEDVCENVNDVDVIIVFGCSRSRFQKVENQGLLLPVNHFDFEIDRKNIYGEIKVQAFYILNCDYEENDFMAYKKGSVLGSSEPITIISDYIFDPFGGAINEKFKKFEGENKNALYHFEFDEDDFPTIIYNERFSNFTNLISTKTKKGHPKTLLRDFLLFSFVSQIYYDLSCRLPENEDAIEVDSAEYKAAKSLGKLFNKKKLSDILAQFKTSGFFIEDKNSSIFQHAMNLGPILEEVIEQTNEETD